MTSVRPSDAWGRTESAPLRYVVGVGRRILRCRSVVRGRGFDAEDGDRGFEEGSLGGAAEDELADRGAAAEAEDDEADVVGCGRLEELAGHVAAGDRLLDGDLDSAFAKLGLGCGQLLSVRVAGVDVGV